MVTEEFAKLKKSRICKLTYQGKLMGYRAIIYNLNSREYMYIDFSVDQFSNMPKAAIDKISNYITTNYQGFEELPLIDKGDELFTQEEIAGNVRVTEVEDVKVIYNYICKIIQIQD